MILISGNGIIILRPKFLYLFNFLNNCIMSLSRTITIVGGGLLLIFIIIQIMNFYGVEQSAYGTYIVFFLFMLLSLIILPNNPPTLNALRALKA